MMANFSLVLLLLLVFGQVPPMRWRLVRAEDPFPPIDMCQYQSGGANDYIYDSAVTAFTESMAKSILFTANFTLYCDHFDHERLMFNYSIIINRIATKMVTTDGANKASNQSSTSRLTRRRKIPYQIRMKTVVDPLTDKHETKTLHVRKRRAIDEDVAWYDLVPVGLRIRFSRLVNGTVTEIRIPKNVIATVPSNDVAVGILKTLALLFNVNRNFSKPKVVEYDDFGQHYSEFSFSRTIVGDKRTARIEKTVKPDDFFRGQFERINAGKLAVKQKQVQFVDYDTLLLYNISGTVSTSSSSSFTSSVNGSTSSKTVTDAFSFQLDATYTLKLMKTTPDKTLKHGEPDRRDHDDIYDFSTFAPQNIDDSNELQKILTIKEQSLQNFGDMRKAVKLVIEEVRVNGEKKANLIRGALVLESTLFRRGKRSNKQILDGVLPVAAKAIVESINIGDYKVTFRLLYVLSGADSDEVNKMFLSCFGIRGIVEKDANRRTFFNTISQVKFPSDLLLERVFMEFSDTFSMNAMHKNAYEGNEAHHRLHPMLTAGNMMGRQTLSNRMRRRIVSWFSATIESTFFPDELDATEREPASRRYVRCREVNDETHHYEPFFTAISNFMSPEVVEDIDGMADMIVDTSLVQRLFDVAENCHSTDSYEFALTALQSLRRVYHLPKIAERFSRLAIASTCERRVYFLRELISRIEDDERLKLGRHWPRYGVVAGNSSTSLDTYTVEQFLNILDFNESSYDCDRSVLVAYLKKKRGHSWDELFESIAFARYEDGSWNNNGTLRRAKRQLGALGSLGGLTGGSSTGGGGGGGASLTPDTIVECDKWDSQVGKNYKSIYSNPSYFDIDSVSYGSMKRHCIFDLSFKFGGLLQLGIQAGFFSGKNNLTQQGRLFGRAWAGLTVLGSRIDFAEVQFTRYQAKAGFRGDVLLKAMNQAYLEEKQDRCNLTYRASVTPLQWTLPAFRVAFAGFTFLMTADFSLTLNFTLNPSYCGADGEMGGRFLPMIVAEATAYAELENDFFGIGMQASINLNYYFDGQIMMPTGCFYMFHGNDDMYLKFDFYVKIPGFVFLNTNVKPVTLRQPWPIFTWQLIVKKAGRYVLIGVCFPINAYNLIPPDAIPYYQT